MYIFQHLEQNFLKLHHQLNSDLIYELLDDLQKDSLLSQGKVNMTELYSLLKEQEGSHILNKSDFNSIFGSKK